MNITELTIVNACLASMGEEPINSLAEVNAFVNSAKFALEQAITNELSHGWYFNTETLTIHPNSMDRMYYVPADVLDFTKDDINPGWAVLRGARVYDKDNAVFLTGTTPIKLRILRALDLGDMPIMARRMVKAATVQLFQQNYDGDAQKISDAAAEYQMAYIQLNTQHIRSVQANLLPRRGAEARRGPRRLPT